MRFLIIGSGAIGTLIGGVLQKAGHETVFFDLPEVAETIKKSGIRVEGLAGEISLSSVEAVSSVEGLDPFDGAVIAVKSYSTAAAIGVLGKNTARRVFSFQNGLDNEEMLAEKFGPENVVAGSITYPVTVLGPGHVRIENSRAGIGIGSVDIDGDVSDMASVFKGCGLNVVLAKDYRSLKWSKLLLNLVCNASCAILGMTPGEIFSDRRLVGIEREQILEALRVMDRRRIEVMDLPGYPVKKIATLYRLSPPSVLKLLMKKRIAGARGNKKPSLMLEMERNAEKTEVRFLNGSVYRHAFSAAIKAPVNKILYETLEDIAGGFINRDDFRGNPQNFLNLFK